MGLPLFYHLEIPYPIIVLASTVNITYRCNNLFLCSGISAYSHWIPNLNHQSLNSTIKNQSQLQLQNIKLKLGLQQSQSHNVCTAQVKITKLSKQTSVLFTCLKKLHPFFSGPFIMDMAPPLGPIVLSYTASYLTHQSQSPQPPNKAGRLWYISSIIDLPTSGIHMVARACEYV